MHHCKKYLCLVYALTLSFGGIASFDRALALETRLSTSGEIVVIDISSESLADALVELAKQTQLQILFGRDVTKNNFRLSNPIVGAMRAEDALTILLQGLPLEFVFISKDVVVIRAYKASKIQVDKPVTEEVETENIEEVFVSRKRIISQPDLNQIVVTAAATPKSQIQTAGSVSVATDYMLNNAASRSTAEILRMIPGVGSQGSSGSGFANATIRGLPFHNNTGSRFLLIQEDGLPNFQFGDIEQVYQDIYARRDASLARVEVVKHGAAATFASNSPGGLINFISKTGEEPEASLALTSGISWDSFRLDLGVGRPLNEHWRFFLSGFYRAGDGVRSAGYEANKGAQLKFNLTHTLDSGEIRFFYKYLDDKTIAYLPMPQLSDGRSIEGFDALFGSQHSIYLQRNSGVDAHGNRYTSDLRDGLHAKMQSTGFYLDYLFADIWRLENNFRSHRVEGGVRALLTSYLGEGGDVADTFFATNETRLFYATGQQRGESIDRQLPAHLVHLLDADIDDLGSVVNDLRLHVVLGDWAIMYGYYKANQEVDTEWLWSSYLMEIAGSNANLIDVQDAQGQELTLHGLAAYGTPFWSNCCQRLYDQQFDINALYSALTYEKKRFNVEASIRYDFGRASGGYAGVSDVRAFDVNNDQIITGPERFVPIVDARSLQAIDYDWSDYSYSLGANWSVSKHAAIFARLSSGIRVGADRELFAGGLQPGGSIDSEVLIDRINHYEFGFRKQAESSAFSITAFSSQTKIADNAPAFDAVLSRTFVSNGIEFEGFAEKGGFSLQGGLSLTDTEVQADDLNSENIGEPLLGQPRWTWKLIPSLSTDRFDAGLFIIGQTESPGDQANTFQLPGYTTTSLFANWYTRSEFSLSLNVTNLMNTRAVTEVLARNEVNGEQWWAARSYPGRASSLTLRWKL